MRLGPMATRALTGLPTELLAKDQLMPLSEDRRMLPLDVPAKRLAPIVAKQLMSVLGNPVLTDVQLVPLLVERKIPVRVPATTLEPTTARAQML